MRNLLVRLVFLCLLTACIAPFILSNTALAAACSTTTITVTQQSSNEFVIDDDTTPLLDSAYMSYRINTGASASFSDLWVKAEGFSDATKLDLATYEDGLYHIGNMATNTNADVYFYLKGAATNTAQTYTLNLYEGNPNFGGVSYCTQGVSNSKVIDEIQAAANKVTSVTHTAPYIGGTMTIVVTGETGTMSSSRPEGSVFSYTPASVSTWPADCYELYDTHVEMTGGNTVSDDDGLLITTTTHGIGSSNTSYTVTYYFTAACTTAAPTSVTPVNYISSGGTNLKHTDTGTSTYAAIPPVPPAENRIVMSKSVSPGGSAGGGTANYTLTFTNTAPVSITLDIIQDNLPSSPANATYVNNSSYFDSNLVSNPNISGQQLTWTGNYVVPANSSKDFDYQATIPVSNGMYTNSAIAFVGSTQIDLTLDTEDNTPATATYGVGDPNLATSTKSVNDLNGGNVEPGDTLRYTIYINNSGSINATGVDLTDSVDTDTDSVSNVLVGAMSSDCGLTYSDLSTSTELNITNLEIDSGTSCVIQFDVLVKLSAIDDSSILNTAIIGTPDEGGVGGSPSSTPLSVQLTPNLVVTKTENDSDDYITAGQSVTYTITIDNDGEADATGVDVIDTITGAASAVGTFGFTNCGSVYTNNSSGLNIDITNVDVAIATNCVITYVVTVNPSATNGQTIDNSVNVGLANQGGNDPGSVSATTLTVGVAPVPNLSVTKTENDADNTVTPGQTITYTVTIINNGTGTGTTSFTDTIDTDYGSPSGFNYTNCGSPSESFSAPTLTISNLTVTTTSDCVVTYDVTVDSPSTEGSTLVNSVDVAQASEGGNNPAPVAATNLTINVTPNLSTSTKAENDADNVVTPGQTITYTITIINTGDGNATGVNVTDTVDTDTSIQTGTISLNNCGTYTNNTSASQLDIVGADVTVGVDCVITFDVLVSSPRNEGTLITNSASISASIEGGSGATPSSTNLSVDATPNLSVTKTENDADDVVAPGQTITYTITISNSGDGVATTSLTDAIDSDYGSPSNFSYSNCGSPSESFSIPTLSISSISVSTTTNCIITYDLTVDSPSIEGTVLSNTADVAQASEGGNNPAPVSATNLGVNVTPNLSTSTKTENDADDVVAPGQTITYTITIINTGNGIGTGIDIIDTVSSDISIQTGTVALSNCGSSYTNNSTSSQIDILDVDVSVSTNCVVSFNTIVDNPLDEGTVIPNSATISASSEGGSGGTPTSTNLVVDSTPTLYVSKTEDDADNVVSHSQSVIYTIKITNSGNGTATTSLTDTIDSEYSAPSNFIYADCGSPTSGFNSPTLTISSLVISAGTDCTISYAVSVGLPLSESSTLDNAVDVYQASEGGNNPAIVNANPLTFEADDGSDTPTENASPNGGDANNDGEQDSDQPDVTSFINPVTNSYAVIENSDSCVNQNVSQVAASSMTANDGSYQYPVGLMNFTLVCGTPGLTATVTQYFYSSIDASKLVARKFSNLTNSYQSIVGATITNTTINSQPAVKITYQITDGGSYDDDGLVNGTIVDPSGPALLGDQTLTKTGRDISIITYSLIAMILAATINTGNLPLPKYSRRAK